jgi:hypothetical protein
MNSYQLTSKLRKVRADTYLTATDQALYHELVAICNDKGWRETFEVKNIQLCFNLNITEKTLIKSRQLLCDAGLIYFKSCKDKRIGCCYSFLPVLSTGNITVDNTGDITAEGGTVTEPINIFSPRLSTLLLAGIFPVDKKSSTVLSTGIFPDETPIPPYKRIQTINRESLAHTHESPPPEKPKKSRKEEGDSKPLVYPFSSIAFMSAWETLRQSPKWKKKLNLALQLSLDKLSKFEEEFAIRQIERAIESNWTGVVFTGTERDYQEWLKQKYGNNQQNRGTDSSDIPKSAGIKSISFD